MQQYLRAELAAGSHILYYGVMPDGVIDVVRALHQRMDVDPAPLTVDIGVAEVDYGPHYNLSYRYAYDPH
jgi:hypothetical protein